MAFDTEIDISKFLGTASESGVCSAHLKDLIDAIPVALFVKDRRSRILLMNTACEEQWGMSFAEVCGTDARHCFPADQMEWFLTKDREVFANGRQIEVEETIWNARLNENRIGHTIKRPIYDVAGNPLYLICTTTDITERKRAEESVKVSRDQLNEAQRLAMLGSWTLDLRDHHLVWSDEIFRIFEIDPMRFGASYEAFLNAVHPGDRDRVNRAYTESVANRTPYEITHRLLFPDGRIKYVHERCETLYAADGTPVLSRGTVQDITQNRLAEEALQLYASAFQHSGEAILISDRDNRIVDLNPSFTRHTGYTLEDLRGQNPRVLSSGHTPRETYQTMWEDLKHSGHWQGELWDRSKTGEIYPKWTSISVIRDEQGEITHYIASFTDISERKAAEERIHRLAHHDMLTGLLNRFSLESRLEQAVFSARREGVQLVVMFLDMDQFKLINDTHGHHVGDELLVQVAQRLQSSVRESDIVARLGGDEFVVVLTSLETGFVAAPVASKIVHLLSQPYHLASVELHTSPSVGISIFPDDGDDAETLLKNADRAMYHAKDHGRNNYQFFASVPMAKSAND